MREQLTTILHSLYPTRLRSSEKESLHAIKTRDVEQEAKRKYLCSGMIDIDCAWYSDRFPGLNIGPDGYVPSPNQV